MATLTRSQLKTLMEPQSGPCISMFSPTYRAGAEIQQNSLRLRNQIREADNRLHLSNISSSQVEILLKPLHALLMDKEFWQHPCDGLAIFRSPNVFRFYHVPYSFKEQVVVTRHFYLKPLLPFLTNDGRFYILALSQNDIRLLECTHYSVSEIALPEAVPESLAEALKYDNPDNQVSYHSSSSGALVGKGGRRAAIFYGQGVGIDDTKENLLRYFQQVDRGLHELLHEETVPLALAAVEYLLPIYREANTYPHLLEQGVTGNPDKMKAETLCEHAWTIVGPYFLKTQQEAAAKYREYAGTNRASHAIREIIPAAYYGRIESLFITLDQEQWGVFDPASNTLHAHKDARFCDDDLLDIAATQTLLHHGTVYAVEQTEMPDQTPVAAVFRY
jgi:hypothetical protein